jgi:FkbM family methyltransferase
MIVDVADIYMELYFFGCYELETALRIRKLLRRGDVVLDIGANAGYYSLLMADIVGEEGHVHAFEPNPGVASVLRASVGLNRYERRVTVNEIVVSGTSRHAVPFYISRLRENSGLSSTRRHSTALVEEGKILVKAVSVDDYVRAKGLHRCDGVKIDVETTEAEVVRGMDRTLRDLKPSFIVCETLLGGDADAELRAHGFVPQAPMGDNSAAWVAKNGYWGNVIYVSGKEMLARGRN